MEGSSQLMGVPPNVFVKTLSPKPPRIPRIPGATARIDNSDYDLEKGDFASA